MSGQEIEPRVTRLEGSFNLLQQELQQTNKILGKIDETLEKQVEASFDLRLLAQKFESHLDRHKEDYKAIHEIDKEIKDGIRPITLKNLLIYAAVVIIGFGVYIEVKATSLETKFELCNLKADDNKNQITYLKGRIKQ
jgi:hypothetical protein